MCRRGRGARLKRYLNSTGSTGAPATNAPVEKVSRQCAGLVVPSGATVNSGYLQLLPASKRKPPCHFFPVVPSGANMITAGTCSIRCLPVSGSFFTFLCMLHQVSRQLAGLIAPSDAATRSGRLQRCLALVGKRFEKRANLASCPSPDTTC